MKLKNRPSQYVKRSDLPGRPLHVKRALGRRLKQSKDRDFSKVEIDSNFYFTWRRDTGEKNH